MLFLDYQYDAGGLAVEGAGGVLDRIGDELLDLGVRNGGRGREGVVGAAIGHCGHEGVRGGHGGGRVEETELGR